MAYLLLHGLGGDREQPLSLIGPVLPQGARVYAPDLRAHGESPLIGDPADFSFDAMTAELSTWLRSQGRGDEPLTVIGISLGAALAVQLAKQKALPIESLVLLRPAFTDLPLPPNLAAFPVIGELLHRHGARQAEERFRGTGLYRAIRAESRLGAAGVIEQFRKPAARERAIRLVEFPRNRVFEPGERPTLPPAHIIAAPRDPLHPLEVAQQWHRMLDGSRLTVVPPRDEGMTSYLAATREAVRSAVQAS